MADRDSKSVWSSARQAMLLVVAALFSLAAPAQSVGDKAPLTDFTTFEGDTVSAASLTGRPVLLYFWASWCPTCMNEMPAFKKIHAKYKDRGFEIVALSFREEPVKSQAFFKKHGFDFPGGPINASYSANYPNLRGTPTWFLIDRDGIIRKKFVGVQEVFWELEKGLVPLL